MERYRNWSLVEGNDSASQEGFLRTFLSIEKSPLVAQRSDTRLQIFALKDFFLTIRAFGSKKARKDGHIDVPVITGGCLWDARWRLETKDGRSFSPCFLEERRRIVSENPEVTRVLVPADLGLFHTKLLQFQKVALEGLRAAGGGRSVQYLIPGKAYEGYIEALPVDEKKKAGMQEELAKFIKRFRAELGELGQIEIIDPLVDDPGGVKALAAEGDLSLEVASFVYPYVANSGLIGVEDLVEYSLLASAENICRKRGWRGLSLKGVFGILGIPNPYDQTEGEVMII